MSALSFFLVLVTEMFAVGGQIFLKHAMNQPPGTARGKVVRIFAGGIALLALNFFLWLGLLSKFELSFLYPFDGLNRILLVVGASLFLREKMSLSICAGVLLISAGVALVVAS